METELTITGVTVTRSSETGWLFEPALLLSDGTICTPMGAGRFQHEAAALAQGSTAVMEASGPVIRP